MLDEIDIKLLKRLQNNSNITTKELASHVNLSATPVFERIKKLENEGYIKKYVAILDADKEGFLRNERSLVQTIGRAARNEGGRVIMYADKITGSMQTAMDETNRRRSIQLEYNLKNNITPTTIIRSKDAIMGQTKVADSKKSTKQYYVESEDSSVAADPVVAYMTKEQLNKLLNQTQRGMEKAAKELDFMEAARLRDELLEIKKMIADKK